MFTDRKCIAYVDDQCALNGPERSPPSTSEDLKSADLVLLKNCQSSGVAVGPGAESQLRLLARRVVVAPHDRACILKKISVVFPFHP